MVYDGLEISKLLSDRQVFSDSSLLLVENNGLQDSLRHSNHFCENSGRSFIVIQEEEMATIIFGMEEDGAHVKPCSNEFVVPSTG